MSDEEDEGDLDEEGKEMERIIRDGPRTKDPSKPKEAGRDGSPSSDTEMADADAKDAKPDKTKGAKIKIKTGNKGGSENAPPGEPKAVLKLKIKSEPSAGAEKPAGAAPPAGGSAGGGAWGRRSRRCGRRSRQTTSCASRSSSKSSRRKAWRRTSKTSSWRSSSGLAPRPSGLSRTGPTKTAKSSPSKPKRRREGVVEVPGDRGVEHHVAAPVRVQGCLARKGKKS
ncbi:hypothetical protein T484DRAFT_3054647 [Baffinella frigidus]|nr:hypothetical protein T484DRAFT_3054647 [Cryptophyta sp. CCMP2293]